jgi:hypothetical protein
MFLKLPILFLNPRMGRRRLWPDQQDEPELPAGTPALAAVG